MDYVEVMARAASWMSDRGWKTKIAKTRKYGNYEQTLFDHTIVEIDVLSQLLSILRTPAHYNIAEKEERVLVTAIVAHDLGKERDEWQSFAGGLRDSKAPQHVVPELVRVAIPEIWQVLGFGPLDEGTLTDVAVCAEFHHTVPGRGDGQIAEAILKGESERFMTLAHLVRAVDRLCSAASVAEARDCISGDRTIGHHLAVTAHRVVVRGVSTTFLHYAAQEAYRRHGWIPILYFPDATLYVADPNSRPSLPVPSEIQTLLKDRIQEAVARDVSSLMVGSPTGNVLPKPHLVDFSEVRKYLERAAVKVSPGSLARKKLADKRRVVESYYKYKGWDRTPTDEEVEHVSKRISVAQPEMMVFKVFKALLDKDRIPELGQNAADLARGEYEAVFGPGSWRALQSTANLMPARDMAKTIDYYWSLPGKAVGHPEVGTVAELDDRTRVELLTEILCRILDLAYSQPGVRSPRDSLAERIATRLIGDLVEPAAGMELRDKARTQLFHYSNSKPCAGRESTRALYLCPICNSPFDYNGGVKASADFLDNPQSHTNRGAALGPFGYIRICNGCYYERLLLQVLLGTRPVEMITLLPRLNLGPGKGEQLTVSVRRLVEAAKAHMRGEGASLEFGLSFGHTSQAARNLQTIDPTELSPEKIVRLFEYRHGEDTRRKRKSELVRRLVEEFEDLDAFNFACGQSFSTWDEAAGAVIEGRVDQQEVRVIRREVFHLYETIDIICETPNLVFVPLSEPVTRSEDESEVNRSLRKLYVALLLSLVFDASVAIHGQGEPIDFRGGTGAAYVPPVAAVRSLVGHDWVPLHAARHWLEAIGAASCLAPDTGFSRRSDIYQVLTMEPPHKIIRRIETATQQAHREVSWDHIRMAEVLIEFHKTKSPGKV